MKARELKNLGVPTGEPLRLALASIGAARAAGMSTAAIRRAFRRIIADPAAGLEDDLFGSVAAALARSASTGERFEERDPPAPWRQWGDGLDPAAVRQLAHACRLPISVRGALMPDAHVGYGLPIGGVLATRDAVIPYAVGVDIACRMKLTVLDLPASTVERQPAKLARALEEETRFGLGVAFDRGARREDPVLEEDWSITEVTRRLRDRAWEQLGTSGTGNHFVEFGVLELSEPELGLEAGEYLALMSHSGSRGPGAAVAGHYSRRAQELHPDLPKELRHLAWLDMDSADGQEYWSAMELMGRYAAANHAAIHRHVARHLGARGVLSIENHHNFAWREEHDGREVIVHRKGATPAGKGVLGVIPGSMATATHVVRGRGNEESLRSASHGAGRVMSRAQARSSFAWPQVRKLLVERGVRLLSAGIDEVPGVYKDIERVMAAQRDLVESLARFRPRVVKMAPGGKPED